MPKYFYNTLSYAPCQEISNLTIPNNYGKEKKKDGIPQLKMKVEGI